MTDWWKMQMLCGEKRPNCSECLIEKKLKCNWYQGKHYDQEVYHKGTYTKGRVK